MTEDVFVREFGKHLCGLAEETGSHFEKSNLLRLLDSSDLCYRIQVQVLHCLTLHHTLALSQAPIFSHNHELRAWLQVAICSNFGKRCEKNFGTVLPVQTWSRRSDSLRRLARQCASYNPQTFDVGSADAAFVTLAFRAGDFVKEMEQGALAGSPKSGVPLDLYFPVLRRMASEVGFDKISQNMLDKMAMQLGLSVAVFRESLDLAYVD